MNIVNEIPRVATKSDVVCLDTEIFHIPDDKMHRPVGDFACLSVQFEGDDFVYQIYDTEQIAPTMRNLKDGLWVFQNALFDLRQLRRWEKDILYPNETLPVYDTMLVEKALWNGYYKDFSLKAMARRYLDIQMDKDTRDQFITADYMTREMKEYAANDVAVTLAVRREQLKMERDISVYWDIDMPMLWVVLDMPPAKVDTQRWLAMAETFEQKGREIEASIGVNVKSPQQVKAFLHSHKIKVESTGAEVLSEYEGNENVDAIVEARLYRDASSRYGKKWIENYVEEDDLVYSSWNITQAETGRMSSSDPSLQQIPARKIPEYRELFISKYEGGTIFAPDISQQEPRCLGYLSGDKALLQAFKNNESVHVTVARLIFDDPTIQKGEDLRYKQGKAISLGISYGLTPQGLAQRTGVSLKEAEELIRKYFNRFPDIAGYMYRMRSYAMKHEYVETVKGRRVWLNTYNYQWENNAINAPIQGSAADFTKIWGAELWRNCKAQGIPFPVIMFVHDEIVMDVPDGQLDAIKEINSKAIQKAAEMFPGIPFTFDENMGTNWACHK